MSLAAESPLSEASLNRRQFARRVAGASVAMAAGGMLSQECAAQTKSLPPGRYVDVHTHVGQTWNKNSALTPEELLRWMDANDIAQAVVLPLVSPEASSYPLST